MVTKRTVLLFAVLLLSLIIVWTAFQLSGILVAFLTFRSISLIVLFSVSIPLLFLPCSFGQIVYMGIRFAFIKELNKVKGHVLGVCIFVILFASLITYALLVTCTERLRTASQFSRYQSSISLNQLPSVIESGGFNEFTSVVGARYLRQLDEDTPGMQIFFDDMESSTTTMYLLILPLVQNNFNRNRDKVSFFVAHYSFIFRTASEEESRSKALEETTDFTGHLYFPPDGVPNENIARTLVNATGLYEPNGFRIARILNSTSVLTTGYILLVAAIIFTLFSFSSLVAISLFCIFSLSKQVEK